jgi:uncharacterized protein YmfQ (DUF2313 family)
MASPRALWAYDLDGAPLLGGAFTIAAFVNRAGGVRTPPVGGVVELGDGQYAFQPLAADETVGTIAIVDCGVLAAQRYQVFAIFLADSSNAFAAYVPLNPDGTLGAGAPTVGSFRRLDVGTSRPPPTIVQAGGFEIYSASPTPTDISIGVGLSLTGPTGMYPGTLTQVFTAGFAISSSVAPAVGGFVPALPGPLANLDPFQFDVTVPDATPLANCDILLRFPSGAVEVVYDGASFSPFYIDGSSVSVIANGARFVVLRRGGWRPIGAPTLEVRAVSVTGVKNEAPITFVWQLTTPAPVTPPGETALGFSALAYARQLRALLPPGLVWMLEANSKINLSLESMGTELARVDARAVDLTEESDPRTTDELLEDWERVLGLPSGCVLELATTDAGRRQAIVQALVNRGGQTLAFFIEVALAVGAVATIKEFTGAVLRAGRARSGDRCYGTQWVHIWDLEILNSIGSGTALPAPTGLGFGAGATTGGTIPHGTACKYRVVARNASGTSNASSSATHTPGGVTNTNRNDLFWTAVDGATSYDIFADYTGGDEKLIGTSTTTGYADTGGTPTSYPPILIPTISSVANEATTGGVLIGGVEVFYRVAAINAAGETFGSAPASVTPPLGTNTNTARINWTQVVGGTGYRIYGRSDGAELLIGQVGAVGTFVDTGVFEAHAFPATVNRARSDPRGLASKGTALECVIARAAPAHSIVLFELLE